MRRAAGLVSTALLLIGSACEQRADQTDDGRQSKVTPSDSTASYPGSSTTDSSAADHGAAGHGIGVEGQALLPIMQRLGAEMTTLTHALMTDDYAGVEGSAAAIAEHAPLSAEELDRIHNVLGAEMRRFEAVDESVHVASVRLHEAARTRQPGEVVAELGAVQRGCVSCHVQFRERLLTNRGGQ